MRAVPWGRCLLFFSIAIAGCLLDLATKQWIFGILGMPPSPPWWLWENYVGFQTSLNEGALWGIGQGWQTVFAALSVLAAIGILVWLFYGGAARDLLLTIALGCIIAGILGNLYDRLGLHGLKWINHPGHQAGDPVYAVRDWILVMIGDRPWPNFNVADSLLVCGAFMLAWHALFAQPGQPEPSPTRR